MNTESEFKKEKFTVSECTSCNNVMWPHSQYCNKCFNKTTLREGKLEGKIIEYSKQGKTGFCLAEFESGIKIIGKIEFDDIVEGQLIKIKECGVKNGNYVFEFTKC